MRYKISYRVSAHKDPIVFSTVSHYGSTFSFDTNFFILEDLPKWAARVYKTHVKRMVKEFMKDPRKDQQNFPTRYDSASGFSIHCTEWSG